MGYPRLQGFCQRKPGIVGQFAGLPPCALDVMTAASTTLFFRVLVHNLPTPREVNT